MGARPLRRAIQRYIEDPLADFVLRAELTPGATVLVERGEGTDDNAEAAVKLTVVEPDPAKVPATMGPPEEEASEGEPKDEGGDSPSEAAPVE
jgi:ATP-dependent Clp protease ATP-binding subunit ClpC